MMPQAIQATLTRCRDGQSLIVLNGGPFNGVEIRPGKLREMAQVLNAIANMAVQLPTGGKHWRPTHLQLGPLVRSEPAE